MKIQALSIRQPWAWLIVNGYKDVENRDWLTRKRGLVYIHAGLTLTKTEYEDAVDMAWVANPEIVVPEQKELLRGGIVGTTEIKDCVSSSDSIWFVGDYGFNLENSKPCEFIPCKGSLSFFFPELKEEVSL